MQLARGWIEKRANLMPQQRALFDLQSERSWSYAQLIQQAAGWQAVLQRAELKQGDRIAVLAENCIDFFAVLFACEASGVIFVPLNWRLHVQELQSIVDDCQPSLLLYSERFANTALQLALPCQLLVEQPAGHTLVQHAHTTDCWMIIYTGGTTGKPKGVMLSYEAVNCNAVNTIISWSLHDADVTVNYMPLFHTGGLNALSIPLLLAGGTVVIGSKFDATAACTALEAHGATIALFVPTMYQEMIATSYFQQAVFPTMHVFLSGGAPCPPTIYDAFAQKGLRFKEGYGLTEAGPNNFYISPEMAAQKKGAVGKSMLLNEVKIVHDDGTCCAVNEVGHLYVKGSHMFTAYWQNADETARTIVDGWLKTGDLARMDEDGDIFIVGRAKDMIISGGENVYPQEVEACISQHEAIASVAVVGAADSYWGEIVTAFIVLKDGQIVTNEQLRAFCQQQLSNYKIPKHIHFVEALPVTSVGKIDKKALLTMI